MTKKSKNSPGKVTEKPKEIGQGDAGVSPTENGKIPQESQENISEVRKYFSSTTASQRLPMLILLTVLALATRLYKIDEPDHICWDETHFGKMGSWYIKNEFFFDVHPPLAKMVIGWAGILTGYNGTFPFGKPGEKYGDTSQFVGMRVICAIAGSLVIPLCYEAVFFMTSSVVAASFAAVLLLLDSGMITISQYILLDQWLLLTIMMGVVSITRFRTYYDKPFTKAWWVWLILTGVSIACAMGVKFVGLFVVLYVGVNTIVDLWNLLGNLSLSIKHISKEFLARAACLILLPVLVYMSFYVIHFRTLYKSGPGDGHFSSAFQSQLIGNRLNNASMPAQIAYGSVVTIKNYRTAGAYLHSHHHLYPEDLGPKQQQVTTYSHKDENNKWLIKKADVQPGKEDVVEIVKSGDIIRLEHTSTGRNLHSHHEKAPITRSLKQVTCYGTGGSGDANDMFRIVATKQETGTSINTVLSKFQLVHVNANCVIKSHNVKLPKWGWDQLEVACNPKLSDSDSYWNIEEVFDDRMPNASFSVYAPSFLENFIEAHAVMLQGNAGLKPKEGEIVSRPWQWPINYKGQGFSGGDYRVYLLGNPVIWWSNLFFMALFGVIYIVQAIRTKRGYIDPQEVQEKRERTFTSCLWLLLAWALHYFPFWTMGRVLYFHHYFPSLLFSTMFSGVVVEYVLSEVKRLAPEKQVWNVHHTFVGGFLSIFLYSFYLFHPFAYGMHGPMADNSNSTMHGLKWLSSWDI